MRLREKLFENRTTMEWVSKNGFKLVNYRRQLEKKTHNILYRELFYGSLFSFLTWSKKKKKPH